MAFLWSDVCFLAMVIMGLVSFGFALRKPGTRQALRLLLRQPAAVCSGILLLIFLTVAVLDSLHFKTLHAEMRAEGGSLYSLLDKIMAPLGETYEQSYSAPFALNLFSTETLMSDDKIQQVYPRLKFPPETIHTAWESFVYCIIQIAWVLLLMLFPGIFIFCHIRKRFVYSDFYDSLRWGFATLLTCLVVIATCYSLSRSFHVLGTGKIGQDIFYYTLKSIRTALIIGTLTTLFMLPLAVICGLAAGYCGGFVDDMIQYIYTTLSSIPGVLLITASVLSMQTYIASHPEQFPTLDINADARLIALCAILGVTSWTSLCRLLRAEALRLREIDFVSAAKVLGSGVFTIFYRHLLPNVMPMIMMTVVLDFSFLVLAEAVLSYVGVGVSPMTISWGNMINGARLELAREPLVWWPVLAAFLPMFTLVLSGNLFADALRDVIDPKNVLRRTGSRRKLLKHL